MLRVAVAIAPEVRQLLHEDPSQLSEFIDEIHNEDIADLMSMLDEEEAAQFLKALHPEEAAPILERLDADEQEAMVEKIGFESMAPIVGEMKADDRTDLIESLPEAMGDTLLETLEKHDPEAAAEVEELAKWAKDSAGGLMTTDYVAVGPTLTVHDVIEVIRKEGTKAETVYYVYVVGNRNKLLGVASLRDILLAKADAKVEEIMMEMVHAVSPTTDQEDVARTMAKYDFSALPVVGPAQKLLGVITVDDVMDVLTAEQAEDVQRMAAVEPTEESYFQTTFWTFIRKRLGWLVILFVSEFFTGTALRHYDKVIEAIATLAFYVPLCLSCGGNSGGQSSSLIIRGLATGDIKPGDYRRIFFRELGQGLVMGTAIGLIGAMRALMWGDGIQFGIMIFCTLIGIVVTGCTIGSMFPLLLKRIGLDPATSSAPFIASLVDVTGLVVYFNIAKIVLSDVLSKAGVH
jgi:magnesium transporter